MKLLTRFAAAALVALAPQAALAGDPPPSVVGTWVTVAGEVGHWEGGLRHLDNDIGTLEVTEQLGGIFRGTMTYETHESGPKHEGADGEAHILTESIMGVVEWDNQTVVWVDHDDETVHRGRLVNVDVMEVIAYESGAHAVVLRSLMVRR